MPVRRRRGISRKSSAGQSYRQHAAAFSPGKNPGARGAKWSRDDGRERSPASPPDAARHGRRRIYYHDQYNDAPTRLLRPVSCGSSFHLAAWNERRRENAERIAGCSPVPGRRVCPFRTGRGRPSPLCRAGRVRIASSRTGERGDRQHPLRFRCTCQAEGLFFLPATSRSPSARLARSSRCRCSPGCRSTANGASSPSWPGPRPPHRRRTRRQSRRRERAAGAWERSGSIWTTRRTCRFLRRSSTSSSGVTIRWC